MKLIAEFDAFYNREGKIYVEAGVCHVCGQTAEVICIDSSVSGGLTEYGPGRICEKCAMKAFKEE
jgi:hypothetical protein